MTKDEARSQLSAFKDYEIESEIVDEIGYVMQDFTGELRSSMYLVFSNNRLKKFTGSSKRMNTQEAGEYRKQLHEVTRLWKESGIEALDEDDEFDFCTYRDDLSYITISTFGYTDGDIHVSMTFAERKSFEAKFDVDALFGSRQSGVATGFTFPTGTFRCTEFTMLLPDGEIGSSKELFEKFSIELDISVPKKSHVRFDGKIRTKRFDESAVTLEVITEVYRIRLTGNQRGDLLMISSTKELTAGEDEIPARFFIDGDSIEISYIINDIESVQIQKYHRISD